MAQFITPEQLKAYALPVTAKQWAMVGDDQLTTVIGFASDHLEEYMDRTILSADYTDRRRGTGTHKMLLSVYPSAYISSAYQIDGLGNSTEWDVSEFYVNSNAGIIEYIKRDKYAFSKLSTWEITYNAGFAAVPGTIQHATALQTVKMLQPIFRGGTNFTETELIADLDEQVMEMLEYYKRRRIA